MKRNHLLLIFSVLLTTIMSCKKKDKVDIDINNSKQPEITGFTPGHGLPGTVVTVSGKNFSTNIPDNKLFLGPQQMVVTEATATTLRFKVPHLAVSGKIKVENGNKSATSAGSFTVDPLPDGIAEISPLEGPFGTEVTIKGANFPLQPDVKINGIKGTVKSGNASEIKFTIPYNTALTKHKIVVEGSGKTYESTQEFTVTAAGKYADWHIQPDVLNTQPVNIFPGGWSFTFNNKLYWGFRPIFDDPEVFYAVYDPAKHADGWKMVEITGKIPYQLQDAIPAVVGDKVYFGNGLVQSTYGKWWSFDPAANSFATITSLPAGVASQGVAFTVNGKLYAGADGDVDDFYAYNPAGNGSWTKVADAVYAQINTGGAVVLGNDVIIGPSFKTSTTTERETMHKFSVNNNTVTITELPKLPDAERGVPMKTPSFALNGKAYFMVKSRVWEYNPAAAAAANPWRMVLQADITSTLEHVGVVNGRVLAWSNRGKFYEFKFRN